MSSKMKKGTVPLPPVSMQGYATKWDRVGGSEGLMKIDAISFVVGSDENRLKITHDGARALATMLEGIRSKDASERMYAARTLLKIVERGGHLCSYLRESVEFPARKFSEGLNKAFSIGDKELNKVLKQIRKKVYAEPEPRHCMIIPVEELEAHTEAKESSLSPNETFYAYCRKMISIHLGPGFKPVPTIGGSVDPDVTEGEVLEAIRNLDMDDPELGYGLKKMTEISTHPAVREAAREKLEQSK